MARLSAHDLDRVQEISAPLRVVEEGTPSPLPALLPEIGRLIGVPRMTAYGVTVEEEGYSLAFGHMVGYGHPEPLLLEEWDRTLRASRKSLGGIYTPARPERFQQNIAIPLPPANTLLQTPGYRLPRAVAAEKPEADAGSLQAVVSTFRRFGVEDHHQLRALVCEDDALLAWVGGFRAEPFTERERLLLQALVPAIARRLSLERLLGSARLNAVTVDALLEQMPVAAALVGPGAKVHRANTAARALIDADRAGFREAVTRALKGASTARLTRIDGPGSPPLYLATFPAANEPNAHAERARQRWGLTQRQGEVLARIAGGESNRSIAARLDCAERTVEAHVTQVLNKLGVESRSAAVARFWSELR